MSTRLNSIEYYIPPLQAVWGYGLEVDHLFLHAEDPRFSSDNHHLKGTIGDVKDLLLETLESQSQSA